MKYLSKFGLLFSLFSFSAFSEDILISALEDTPDPAPRGGEINYAITIANNAAAVAEDVTLDFPLPATTSFVSVDDTDCSFVGPAPGSVSCTFGTVAGLSDFDVNIVIRTSAGTGNSVAVTATAGTSSAGNVPGNDSETQNTTIDNGADLSLTITDSADPVIAGGEFSYDIVVNNDGPNPSVDVTVESNLPPGVDYISANGGGWTCGNSGQLVTCTRDDLANGANAPPITINVEVVGAVTGTITNSANVFADTEDPVPNNNTNTEDTVITPGTDLSISKSVDSPVIANTTATFTLRPRNNGPFDADTVTVTDTLPAGFTFQSFNDGDWTCNHLAGTVTCDRAVFAAGVIDNIQILTDVPANGVNVVNTADIESAVTPDPNAGNNDGSVIFDIVPDGSDLSISKTKGPNPVAQGSDMTSTIVVENLGPRDTTGTVTVVDTLSADETYVSGSGVDWTCGAPVGNPQVVTCEYASVITFGDSSTELEIITTANAAGTITNNACASDVGGQPDAIGGNNCTGAGVTSTTDSADLSITKSVSTAGGTNNVLEVGEDTITYTLTVTHLAGETLNGVDNDAVVVTDDIPGYLTNVIDSTPTTTPITASDDLGKFDCVVTDGVVRCELNNASSFAAGDVSVFTIEVGRPIADGALNNVAEVDSAVLGDPNDANNSANIGVTVDPIADVEMQALTLTPSTAKAGTDVTQVLTFRNNGPSQAADVVVTHTFDPDVGFDYELVSANTTKGSCAPIVGNVLTCTIGTLSRDETRSITLIVRPGWENTNVNWTLGNTSNITTSTTESDPANNQQTADLTVEAAELDLLINTRDLEDPLGWDPTPGAFPATVDNIVRYEMEITNRGPSVATAVKFDAVLAPEAGKEFTFLCDGNTDATCDGGTSICDMIGNSVTGPATLSTECELPLATQLESGDAYTRYLFFRAVTLPDPTGDSVSISPIVSSNEVDTNPNNNDEGETTTLRVKLDLDVDITPSETTVSVFEPFFWTMVVTNSGPGISADTALNDNLPSGMELTGPPVPTQGSCTGIATETDFDCDIGTLNSGEFVTINVPVRFVSYPAGGTSENTATISTAGFDTVENNNEDTETVTVVRSSIAGTVYNDLNDDGSIDGNELGIAGVTVNLSGTDSFGNLVDEDVVTGADGTYIFENLAPSNGDGYSLTETQPANFDDGLDNADGSLVANSRNTDVIDGIDLLADSDIENYNFGNLGQASITGSVWLDENNNGIKEVGEDNGVANVKVTLSGTLDIVTQTDVNGDYEFDNLTAGTYTVTETHPVIWGDGTEQLGNAGGVAGNDVFSNITLTNAQQGSGYNFGELTASLSGKVYRDTNDDGIVDVGEDGMPGVTITLTGTDGDGNPVMLTEVTDSDGNYTFAVNASDGTGYTITETHPISVLDGKDTAGTLGGDAISIDDEISGIVVNANDVGTGYNFGEGADIAYLQGRVFVDVNDNGQIDNGEQGIPGVSIILSGRTSNGVPISLTQITNAQGSYVFETLPASDATGYTITQVQPANYDDGLDSITGVIVADSRNSDVLTGLVMGVSTKLGNNNFGELYKGRLSGLVFVDSNNNGLQDANEVGIPNVEMTLTGTSQTGQPITLTVITDENGEYVFDHIPPSNNVGYSLIETHPVDYQDGNESIAGLVVANSADSDTLEGIRITLSSDLQHYNFAELPIASISGVVFADANNDGVQSVKSNDEIGIANTNVTLTGTDHLGNTIERVTTTDENGLYQFENLPASDANGYQISEQQPSSYNDGLDSIAGVVIADSSYSDSLNGIVLQNSEVLTNNNFGELYQGSLSGFVFTDSNKNGVQDPGEAGIPNVEMILTGTSANGEPISIVVITDENGQYQFSNLPPSDASGYSLTETQPADYLDGEESIDGNIVPDSEGTDTINGIQITLSSELDNYNFAERPIASISGVVFVDANTNGLHSDDESGIEGVTLTLTGVDHLGATVNRTTTTDENGFYTFDLLEPSGTDGYQITQSQPAEYADGAQSIDQQIIPDSYQTNVISSIQLAANTQLENYNFAELEAASISGSVWVDENNNGVRDESELLGIAGVTITLTGAEFWQDQNNVELTLVTDSEGNYKFEELLAGTYIISETQPNAWMDAQEQLGSLEGQVSNDQFSAVEVNSGDEAVDYNFGERGSSLAGRVYNDLDEDGNRSETEPGIPNVVITLTGTDIDGQSVERTVLTGVDGQYIFEHLPLPNEQGYFVVETQPNDVNDGLDSVGSHGGELQNDAISQIVFDEHISQLTGYNFGELLQDPSSISGSVWLDTNHNGEDDDDGGLEGWIVQLIDTRDNPKDNDNITSIAQVVTSSDGNYIFEGLSPGVYEVRFIHPQTGAIYGYGESDEAGVDLSFGTISNITLGAGEDIGEQNLPIDPSGIVYDSNTREPVSGATVRFEGPPGFDPETDLVGGINNIEQVTGTDGAYQFLIFNTAPAGIYTIIVTEPSGYLPGVSRLIPACTNTANIIATPDPALVQLQSSPPQQDAAIHDPQDCVTTSADFEEGENTTQYYLTFEISPDLPSANVINNHIPVDPVNNELLAVVKTSQVKNASRGDFVPYSITVTNNQNFALSQLSVIDHLPPGFKYVQGSAIIAGNKVEPVISEQTLTWNDLNFGANQQYKIDLITVIGAGVGEGEYVNQAWSEFAVGEQIVTNIAGATVRIVPDPLFDCSDITGKVFNDVNANGYQDEAETGIAAVRLATANGLLVTTDDQGRYHIACAGVPNEMRGSNFIIKLDDRTLPAGFRITTENPRVVRLTRGKMVKANFGATIHRVVRIQLNQDAFAGENLNTDSQQQLQAAIKALHEKPSILRLAYEHRDESDDLVERRLELLQESSESLWQECDCQFELIIEQEIYPEQGHLQRINQARSTGNE